MDEEKLRKLIEEMIVEHINRFVGEINKTNRINMDNLLAKLRLNNDAIIHTLAGIMRINEAIINSIHVFGLIDKENLVSIFEDEISRLRKEYGEASNVITPVTHLRNSLLGAIGTEDRSGSLLQKKAPWFQGLLQGGLSKKDDDSNEES